MLEEIKERLERESWEDDIEFIKHAPSDIRALIAMVEERDKEIEQKDFAIKQLLMSRKEGYYAPKIWKDLENAIKED